MIWTKWFPWRYLVSRIARAYGFLDPLELLVRLRNFAHPSEVSEPVELLRAGMLFHARGLINTKAIQHNLDWVWPYWVERQFNPHDDSFIPRAFSFSHINLTHRNWTAVGLPNVPFYPIVDPRGLVTPFYDGWSLDFWIVRATGEGVRPSKLKEGRQWLDVQGEHLRVISEFSDAAWKLRTIVWMEMNGSQPVCVVHIEANATLPNWLVVAIRPYNPEGISFIDSIRVEEDRRHWRVNDTGRVTFSRVPDKCILSTYKQGDVANAIESGTESTEVVCRIAMASGAAMFSGDALKDRPFEVRVPVLDELTRKPATFTGPCSSWKTEIRKCSSLRIPDPWLQELYETAVTSLILHSPGTVFPGPYTYKRFWYRDAAFILNGLVTLGAHDRTRRALDLFPDGQTRLGYFKSQDGEWDSNGEALWIMDRYSQLTGEAVPDAWLAPIEKGARWILRKRLPKDLAEPHAGLLPAGFSAEHLGPNDFYYWDNFWGVAGLRAAARMLQQGLSESSTKFAAAADEYFATIIESFRFLPEGAFKGAIAASPHRRMDAGAVGSLVADYPLQLFEPGNPRIVRTVDYLLKHSSHNGGFFQNMIHSGINAYLTLHLAQVLLRAGDLRALDLVDAVAKMATSTGQWPEAIHPKSGGGCMGDGQHIWASAEWALIIRNLFVREESDCLVLGSGLFPRWLAKSEMIAFGPTLTPFGAVEIRLEPAGPGRFHVVLDADWRGRIPRLDWRIPGYSRVTVLEAPSHFLMEAEPPMNWNANEKAASQSVRPIT